MHHPIEIYSSSGGFATHISTDTSIEELHIFAATLGIGTTMFQDFVGHPHYNLSDNQYKKALEQGAHSLDIHRYLFKVDTKWGSGEIAALIDRKNSK